MAPQRTLTARIGDQLRDPMILLLLAAAALTTLMRDWVDTTIIGLVVVFNTVIGVGQQVRSDRAMAALRDLAPATATVVRDGLAQTVPATSVVPGDLLELAAGDVAAADGTAVVARNLQVNQAHLTGESLPVDTDADDEVPAGSIVTRGRGTVRVTRTGASSGIGRVAALLGAPVRRATPLQQRLTRLSRALVLLVAVLTVAVTVSGLVQGRPWDEMLVVALSLAVAAVPESLPAVLTVALALGARRMARRNAVVRNLLAVETLGSVTVVATDKTGTVTEGTMVVERLWTPEGEYAVSPDGLEPAPDTRSAAKLLRAAALCNDAKPADGGYLGDPLDVALRIAAEAVGAPDDGWERLWDEPFENLTKRMVTVHRGPSGEVVTVCKGAPEVVLAELAAGSRVDRMLVTQALAEADRLAAEGYRVLAVAGRKDDTTLAAARLALRPPSVQELDLLGLVAIGDPPRAHVGDVVRTLRGAGIRLALVSGDHRGTVAAIAHRIGITPVRTRGLDGGELGPLEDVELSVVARVRPDQKVSVVRELQRRGDVVAMLGDGVNDAPAIEQADIGVAAGRRGSEVAKQAADLVLLDDDLSTVVAAVEEGRRIYANLRAFLVFALAGGLAEVLVMLFGPLVGPTLPLLPAQILWINLLTHGITGMAFGAEPADPDSMRRPPRRPSEPILPLGHRLQLGLATVMLSLTSLTVAAASTAAAGELRTLVFLTLGLGQLGVALALRARGPRRHARGLELACLVGALFLLGGTYLGPLQELLSTVAPSPHRLTVAVGAAVLPGLSVGAVRRWGRRPRPPAERGTAAGR